MPLRTIGSGRAVVSCVALLAAGLLGCDGDSRPRGDGTGGTGGLAMGFDSGVGGELPDSGGSMVPDAGEDAGADSGALDAGCPWDGVARYDLSTFPVCDLCENAHCAPTGGLSASQIASLAPCDEFTMCVPDTLIVSGGLAVPASCTSLQGAEGRCISLCVPAVSAQADQLPGEGCASDERCAPCFDPITAADTGACTLQCDPGPSAPPTTFPECCGGLSVCVPTALVAEDQRADLDATGCAGSDVLCAPKALAADANYVSPGCMSVGGSEGRCLPACLPGVAADADRLMQGSCDAGHLCAPCYDPLTAEDTGACTLGTDLPMNPPYTFPTCCDANGTDVGTCVPSALVPADQQALLGADTCTGVGDLCAPTDLANGVYAPEDCDSIGGGEGRCLPACLPDVAAQADSLPQSSCTAGYLCAPCFDPLTGEATGSCAIEGDAPVEPPFRFESCCDAAGTDVGSCVPLALVPADQQSLLSIDTCSGSGVLCAPNDIAGGTYAPVDCDSLGGGEGRCLPECLPDVAAQADKLPQSSCAAGYLCAPCYDPVTGVDTGSCALAGDTPKETKYVFSACCNDSGTALGTCVPLSTVPAEQQSMLGQDDCSAGNLCAPTPIAAGTYVPKTCTSWLGAEARCLPACLPDVAAQASKLEQDICGTGELCVPCFDPLDGTSTGACTLEGDTPANPTPVKFPTCCPTNGTQRGTCVPKAVAGTAGASAPVLTCETATNDADAYICAPNEFIAEPPQDFAPSCTTSYVCNSANLIGCALEATLINAQPGVCAPACLLEEQGNTPITAVPVVSVYAKTNSCATGEVCAPCSDPQDGTATGLCP